MSARFVRILESSGFRRGEYVNREILCYYLPGSEILFVTQDATKYFPEADCLVGKHILDNNLMKALIGTRIYNFIEPEMILCSLEGK
jgi:hypothetical protein